MPETRVSGVALVCFLLSGCGTEKPPPPLSDTPLPPDMASPVDVVSDAGLDAGVDTVLDIGIDTENDTASLPPPFGPVALDPAAKKPPALLSETQLLRWDGLQVTYHPEVFPYAINSPLFSDYALKDRAIWIPPGTSASYEPNDAFVFPVGTVVMKSFLLPLDLRNPTEGLRLIETRLLVMTDSGWKTWPYIWDEDGTDAKLHVSGKVLDISFIDPFGEPRTSHYMIPQKNQCVDCHEKKYEDGSRVNVAIGLKARHLNRLADPDDPSTNQLEGLAAAGLLTGMPAMGEVPQAFDASTLDLATLDDATRDKAARDYLDIGCAHCHHPNAPEGQSSQLFLNHDNDDPFNLGVCKLPGSAGKGGFGRKYNIVPGDPDASILMYRVETEIVGAMMPDIGRSLQDDLGGALLRTWVTAMPYDSCELCSRCGRILAPKAPPALIVHDRLACGTGAAPDVCTHDGGYLDETAHSVRSHRFLRRLR